MQHLSELMLNLFEVSCSGMTCLVWRLVGKGCSGIVSCVQAVPCAGAVRYSSVGRRNGFVWPLKGRPFKACEFL